VRRLPLLAIPAVLAAAAVAVPAGQPAPQPAQVAVQLTVLRHQNVQAFDNQKVKQVLDEMGRVLQNSDPPADVPCNVSFTQKGNVGIFTGPNVISNQQQFNAVANLGAPYHIKVVSTIDWCGAYMPSAVACSPVGIAGTSIVVEEDFFLGDVRLAGVILAHEYGHNRGLSHRPGALTNLMNPGVGPTSRCVNAAEAQHFLIQPSPATVEAAPVWAGPGPIPGLPAAAVVVDPLADEKKAEKKVAAAEVQEPLVPVKDFVHMVHPEGVPYDVASRYTKEDAKVLLGMLKDPAEKPWWTNIATTICFIGDDSAVKELIAFVNGGKQEAKPTRAELDARKAAVAHLGAIVNKTANPAVQKEAIDFLAAVAQGPLTEAAQPGAPARQLAIAAAEGLAVSGKPEAAEILKKIEKSESAGADEVKAAAGQALQAHDAVRKHGLKEYYGQRHRH